MTSYVLALIGFKLLPPDESQLTQPLFPPVLNIWVDRPGVHLMAVLDGELALDGSPLALRLYANKVPGGFHWLITASSDNSSARLLEQASGSWTDELTGAALNLQDSYTKLEHATDLRSTLLSFGNLQEAAVVLVRQDPTNITMIGSRIQVILPGITLPDYLASPPIKSPTKKWYSASGQAVIIAPDELQNYETDVVSPAFTAPELWQSSSWVFPYWLGTDPGQQSTESTDLFIAGLLFGIAGGAIIGCAQELANRYRAWRDNANHPTSS